MKFSTIFLAGLTSASDTNDTAISTLNNLEKISSEILFSDTINKRLGWKHKWSQKFQNNSLRMLKSVHICGTKYDEAEDEIEIEYDTGNPCKAVDFLTTVYSEWTARYIASCNGQKRKSHQRKRMIKWNNMLQKGKRFI